MEVDVILAVLLLVGCAGDTPAGPQSTSLRVSGSDTMIDHLFPALADAYRRQHADVQFELVGGGSASGFRALLDREADLAATSRRSIPAEAEQASADKFDLESLDSRHTVAVNVIAIAVHPSNSIDSLTYDQVIGIFCNGQVDNWAFLGQDDLAIRPLAREPASGTRMVFEDFFCGPKGIHPRVEVLTTDELQKTVLEDAGAITFLSLAEMSGKVLGLRPDAAGHPILPSQQNVIRGAYPLYNDLYLYSRGPAKGATKEFIDWITSPAGQDVVDEQRFVPLFLRPERMDDPRPLRETIHFEPGSSAPNQRSVARLKLLVDELRDRTGEYRHVVLEGYTDNEEQGAIDLAEARAATVKEMLATELPGTYFEIIPRGADNPIAPNATPYGRQQNRRVQIYLAAEEKPGEQKQPIVEGTE